MARRLYSTRDAAEYLGKSYDSTLRLFLVGAIYAWRVNPRNPHSTWQTTRAHLDSYLQDGPRADSATSTQRAQAPPEAVARW